MKLTTLFLVRLGLLAPICASLSAQPMPHHFSRVTVQSDKTILLGLDGSVSNMFNLTGTISNQFGLMFDLYPVEASTNLTNWTRLALLLRTNNNPNPLLFQDTNSAGLNQRFYRTLSNHLITMFPKPSGPFVVGTLDRVMIDPARTNLYRYSPRTNAFMVTIWYPAEPPGAGVLPEAMWDRRFAADTSLYSFFGVDSRWARISPAAVAHRFAGVPLAGNSVRYPVLLFSHGVPVSRKSASHQAEELASHGYVVIAPDHSDCWASEFPDGRYLTGNHSGDVSSRLKDIQFLLDELTRLDTSDPLFAGRIDLDRIGLIGASYGGEVVQTSRTDTRVKCVALYDATNVEASGAGLQKPLLVALGQSNSFYSEDQLLFNNAITNAVFFQIKGADHATCCDEAWWLEIPWGRNPALAFDACLRWFFDKYLKGEGAPFPTNTEIYNIQSN